MTGGQAAVPTQAFRSSTLRERKGGDGLFACPSVDEQGGLSDDLAKRLGGWTEDATVARYDHAERIEELRVEKAE